MQQQDGQGVEGQHPRLQEAPGEKDEHHPLGWRHAVNSQVPQAGRQAENGASGTATRSSVLSPALGSWRTLRELSHRQADMHWSWHLACCQSPPASFGPPMLGCAWQDVCLPSRGILGVSCCQAVCYLFSPPMNKSVGLRHSFEAHCSCLCTLKTCQLPGQVSACTCNLYTVLLVGIISPQHSFLGHNRSKHSRWHSGMNNCICCQFSQQHWIAC